MQKLPSSVQDIADVIGRERALFLIGMLPRFLTTTSRNGKMEANGEQVILYVPRALKPDHQLVAILGWNDAQRMVRGFGGELLKVATCGAMVREWRNRSIVDMVANGLPRALVATWFGVTDRHVRNLMSENPQEACRTAANDNARTKRGATAAA